MKSITLKRRVHAALMVVGSLLAVAAPASALSKARVNVPFEFKVGTTSLRAGEYTIEQISNNSGGVLVVRDSSGKPVAVINGVRVERPGTYAEPRLVFTKYVQGTVLSEVWLSSSESGVSVPKSHFERELLLGSSAAKESVGMVGAR